MKTERSGPDGGARGRPWPRWFVAAGIVYIAVAASIAGVRAHSSSDFRDFWENAQHFRLTGQISSELGVHNYLPAFTLLATPISLLPLPVAVSAFVAVSLIAFAWTAHELDRRLLGRSPEAAGRLGLTPGVVALLLMLPYIHTCAVLGALGLLLNALIVLAWLHGERGREGIAGALLGLATLVKLLPGVLIVMFAIRRRGRVVSAAAITLVAGGVGLPAAAIGWQETVRQHAAFYERAVVGHSAMSTILADKPIKANFSNNALPIVLRRLLSPVNAGKDDQPELYVNIADLPRPAIAALYILLMLLFGGVSILTAIRTSGDSSAREITAGTWLCLALLATPLLWTHYLTLVFIPVFTLVGSLAGSRSNDRRVALAALAVWIACSVLLVWPAARASGAQFLAVAALWLALAVQGLAASRRARTIVASSG